MAYFTLRVPTVAKRSLLVRSVHDLPSLEHRENVWMELSRAHRVAYRGASTTTIVTHVPRGERAISGKRLYTARSIIFRIITEITRNAYDVLFVDYYNAFMSGYEVCNDKKKTSHITCCFLCFFV